MKLKLPSYPECQDAFYSVIEYRIFIQNAFEVFIKEYSWIK